LSVSSRRAARDHAGYHGKRLGAASRGLTLIEMAVVLVIMGLLIESAIKDKS